MKPDGYELHNWDGNFPTVITIFSAPNYEQMENNGAVLIARAAGGFDLKNFYENEEKLSIWKDNKDMLHVMQPKIERAIF